MGKVYTKQKLLMVIFGLLLGALLIESGLRLGGFIYLSLQKYRNRISLMQHGAFRIICLGDSTTAIGGDDSYPGQLEKILNQRY